MPATPKTAMMLLGCVAWLAAAAPAQAQQQRAQAQTGNNTSTPLANLGGNSRDPIKIDADRLDVKDKESMAVFSGNVVAVQGKTTIRCSKMTILYDNRGQGLPGQAAAAPRPQAASGGAGDTGGIKRLECEGPVTVTSEDQVATGQRAVFDREKDIVTMTGQVALAKGPNVTRGERLVYNTRTGIANIEGGRVQGFFVPGSDATAPAAPGRRAGQPSN